MYDGIICPEGHYRVKKSNFDQQCNDLGLPCPEGYKCYCKPCIKAFEVDVLQWTKEKQLEENRTGRVTGCDKMGLCGIVEQTRDTIFRIYDNRERDDAKASAVMHIGQVSHDLSVTKAA